jgi:uncharacterized protein (UPF0261 family)
LNQATGPVTLLLPLSGVSAIDREGKPFYDPAADKALFDTIRGGFKPTARRRLIEAPYALNDPAFAALLVAAFREIANA